MTTEQKYCRPRMTTDARDALDRIHKKYANDVFITNRSEVVLQIESDLHQLEIDKQELQSELFKSNRDYGRLQSLFRRGIRHRDYLAKAATVSILINLSLVLFVAFDKGWF